MQMFTVPQFIDTEDKIIGPITVRQFIICLSGVIVIAISYKLFDFMLFVVIAILCFAVFGSLAFVKINGRPFHFFVLNFVQTTKKPRLRIWNHKNPLKDLIISEEDDGREIQESRKIPAKIRPAGSRLNELSLIVDTKGTYKGEEEDGEEVKIVESFKK